MKRILFVCTGNTCRSPMAEAMLRRFAEQSGLPLEVRSAGLAAMEGMPMSNYSSSILMENNITANSIAQKVDEQLVDWADLILAMTMNHKREMIQRYPAALEKTFTLKEYVADESEGSAEVAELAEMEKLVVELQLRKSLSQDLRDEDKQKLVEFMRKAPNYDIADPFGGELWHYRQCYEEIERSLAKLLDKLKTP